MVAFHGRRMRRHVFFLLRLGPAAGGCSAWKDDPDMGGDTGTGAVCTALASWLTACSSTACYVHMPKCENRLAKIVGLLHLDANTGQLTMEEQNSPRRWNDTR